MGSNDGMTRAQFEESIRKAVESVDRSRLKRLEAENARLRAALRPFAEYYNAREYLGKLDGEYYRAADIKIKLFRAAAEALKEESNATKD